MKRTYRLLGLGMALLVSTSAQATIYGEDDRKDLYELQNPLYEKLADSAVAIFWAKDLSIQGNVARLKTRTLKDSEGVCPTEIFADQPVGARCSGSLVGPDLVLTAGHCMKWAFVDLCGSSRFVFGFAVRDPRVMPTQVPASEVYACKEVVAREHNVGADDFAIVRLDRAVTGHEPLAIDRSGAISVGDPLVVIEYPSGLPVKVAGGAQVLSLPNSKAFIADLDTFNHSSGSVVLNAVTGEVVGVLDDGDEDYVSAGGCKVVKRCAPGQCKGEISTRASAFASAIP